MKQVIRHTMTLLIVLACSIAQASDSNTQPPTTQPPISMPYANVNIQTYHPLNRNSDFNKSLMKWVNIIKACRSADTPSKPTKLR
jgi:hypothetical protein